MIRKLLPVFGAFATAFALAFSLANAAPAKAFTKYVSTHGSACHDNSSTQKYCPLVLTESFTPAEIWAVGVTMYDNSTDHVAQAQACTIATNWGGGCGPAATNGAVGNFGYTSLYPDPAIIRQWGDAGYAFIRVNGVVNMLGYDATN